MTVPILFWHINTTTTTSVQQPSKLDRYYLQMNHYRLLLKYK